jgi:hypothetical protein
LDKIAIIQLLPIDLSVPGAASPTIMSRINFRRGSRERSVDPAMDEGNETLGVLGVLAVFGDEM